jgi:hypothetical protein
VQSAGISAQFVDGLQKGTMMHHFTLRGAAAVALALPLVSLAGVVQADSSQRESVNTIRHSTAVDTVYGDDPRTGESFTQQTNVAFDGTRSARAADAAAAVDPQAAVTGSQPWVNLLCAFPDVSTRSRNLGYFNSMFGGTAPQLDNYWREVSYGKINTVGSKSSDWKVLPKLRSAYIVNNRADLNQLFADCTALHNGPVDFANGGKPFVGINMAFNGGLDCCAWGGSQSATLDGVNKQWRTTWLPPFGYENQGVFAHEMGHGFGLPHSDNTDGDDNTYDSPWDVMSAATGRVDATYGDIATHPVAAHKIELGWYTGTDVSTVAAGQNAEVTIEPATSTATGAVRVVEIPVGTSRYLVEVRELTGSYDGGLPGTGAGDRKVVISKVDPDGGSYISRVVDADTPPDGDTRSEGVQWRPGETFSADGFTVNIVAQTATGMTVQVNRA